MQCFKAWKLEEKNVPPAKMVHWNAICSHMASVLNIEPNSLQDELVAEETTITTMTPAATNDAAATPSPDQAPTRAINFWKQDIKCEGKTFTYNLPTTHKILHAANAKALENDRDTLKRIRKKCQASSYSTNSVFSQVLWSVAMTAVPAMALSVAAYFIPLVIRAFFHDTGLFVYKKFKDAKFAKAFPSDWLLRKYNLFQATRDTMLLAHRLIDKRICLSCDKGNKKGVGHMVKMLSSWSADGPPIVEI